MDSPRHGYGNLHANEHPAGWTAVNRLSYSPSSSMDTSSPRGSIARRSTIPTMPVVKSGGNLFKTPMANAPRMLLPRPQSIIKPQPSQKPCLVCGKTGCILGSHKSFADQALARKKAKQQVTPTKGKTPAHPAQGPSRAPEQFVEYPIAMDSERHQLLDLWHQDWSRVRRGPERHLFPTRWVESVLPTATNHVPLFQALLATSASMWSMAHATLSESTGRHLQMADQVLSQTCTNEGDASKDECLLAALLLTFIYQAQGNRHETDKYFSRIVTLVNQRGGPYYLGMSGVVADLLLYIDHLQAAVLDCEPVWRLHLPALQVGIPPRLGAAFRELLPLNIFSVDLMLAADSICRLTDIFEQHPGPSTPASGAMNAFGYLSTISEYQLSHCNAIFHGSCTWNECICLVLLLFNYTVLRNDGVPTAPARKLESQFWQTVDTTIIRHGFRDVPPCMLLWLFITGLCSNILTESRHRASAVKRMRAAKISAAVTGWEHFKQKALDDFVWLPAAQEDTFRDIWLEVEGYRTVP